jgi:hypothetical protein
MSGRSFPSRIVLRAPQVLSPLRGSFFAGMVDSSWGKAFRFFWRSFGRKTQAPRRGRRGSRAKSGRTGARATPPARVAALAPRLCVSVVKIKIRTTKTRGHRDRGYWPQKGAAGAKMKIGVGFGFAPLTPLCGELPWALQVERLAPKALQDTRPPQHNALALISIARDISAAHGPAF